MPTRPPRSRRGSRLEPGQRLVGARPLVGHQVADRGGGDVHDSEFIVASRAPIASRARVHMSLNAPPIGSPPNEPAARAAEPAAVLASPTLPALALIASAAAARAGVWTVAGACGLCECDLGWAHAREVTGGMDRVAPSARGGQAASSVGRHPVPAWRASGFVFTLPRTLAKVVCPPRGGAVW